VAATVVARAHPTRPRRLVGGERVDTTLLALIQTISEVTDDDREIVATVLHLLRSGRVRLIGTLRGECVEPS